MSQSPYLPAPLQCDLMVDFVTILYLFYIWLYKENNYVYYNKNKNGWIIYDTLFVYPQNGCTSMMKGNVHQSGVTRIM